MRERDTSEVPVWQLRRDEIDAMPESDQVWVRGHLAYLKESGVLMVILANPPGTKFETIWNSDAKQWSLRPAA